MEHSQGLFLSSKKGSFFMRDYYSSENGWSFKTHYNPPVCGRDLLGESAGGYLANERARQVLLHSNYVDPTAYSAYRKSITDNHFQYRKRSSSRFFCDGEWKYTNVTYTGTKYPAVKWVQLSPNGPTHLPTPSGNSLKRARNNLLADIANVKVDLGTALGEVVSAAGEMTRLGVRLGSILLAARRGHWRLALSRAGVTRSTLTEAASDWYLAYNFGIRPIIQDIQNLQEGINNALNRDDAVLSAFATAINNNPSRSVGWVVVKGQLLDGAQVGVSYQLDGSSRAALNSLGLQNPLTIAWNVLSLSFVIDYFLQVGNYLEGLSATHGFSFRSGYETVFVKTDATMTDTYYEFAGGGTTYIGTFPSWTIKEFGMKREYLSNFPKPALTYRFKLDATKLTTLAALGVQLRRR